jgi:probable F420-dependent oxidoreductase
MSDALKLGIITPILNRNNRKNMHGPWERDAGIADLVRIAEEAERLGYHHLTCSEHVALPHAAAQTRGATYWDPLATFGYLAAQTQRIRFATFVLVLAYNHPMAIVKRYGTLDRISGGRVILGVGVGSLKEEFSLLGAPFEGRGPAGDDAIRALRASWGREIPEYHGSHYDYSGFVVDPTSISTEVPIWIGGNSARSLRRAVELGDCWAPFGLGSADITKLLSEARRTEAWATRKRPLEIGLQPEPPIDPVGERATAKAAVERYREAGATLLNLRFMHRSLAHYCEQLAAMRELVPGS